MRRNQQTGDDHQARGTWSRRFLDTVRHDAEARFELRQLVFALCIAVGVVYLASVFTMQPRQRELRAAKTRFAELQAQTGSGKLDALLEGQLAKLAEQKKRLEREIALLRFKKNILGEQYTPSRPAESFDSVIFTLLPLSPVDIERGLVRMNVMEEVKRDDYAIIPVRLEGEVKFENFLYYLDYLEKRPEVGMIADLNLALDLGEDIFAPVTTVRFGLTLGRIQLRQTASGVRP